jgi:glycerophosphoryl diester phosphodiesterase
MVSPVQRIAHRGGAHLAPENTLAAFRNACTLPVDTVELDVQMSRDERLIVIHDNTVERLTNGTGNILDLDFAYLRSLNAATHFPGGWPEPEQIPTLQEVLVLIRGHLRAQIEIKFSKRDGLYGHYPRIAEAVVAEIEAAAMHDQVFVISFDWETLVTVKKLAPAIPTGALVSREWWASQSSEPLKRVCDQALSRGCSWICLDYRLCTPDVPEVVHQHGLQLGLWTVDTLVDLRAFSQQGVDALTSDRPDLFAQL